ncbi:Acb2/Tad1 domain-containing protein [Rhodococcoides fascians]|uniref:Acb2/Tad1 domain-containing protein n=1 Tax=Rhodococcoides fascians TaxID=1828 RepID=UPI0005610992|nr:hypothetical protein [Rhodococcus fascians]
MSDLNNRFDFHPANTPEKVAAHEAVRAGCKALAEFIDAKVPNGREKALAITAIETAMFWGNAAIARSEA